VPEKEGELIILNCWIELEKLENRINAGSKLMADDELVGVIFK
jgi:hypothetical protein